MTVVLVLINMPTIHSLDEASPTRLVLGVSSALLGGVIAWRLPGNWLGWVALANALVNAIPGLAQQYARYSLLVHPEAPLGTWAAWAGNWMQALVYPAAALALLLIPDGQLPSRRWRVVAVVALACAGLGSVITAFDPAPIALTGLPAIANPLGLAAFPEINEGVVGRAVVLLTIGLFVAAGASVVIRMQAASGETRLQLKWIAYAVAVSVLASASIDLLTLLDPRLLARVEWFEPLVPILGFGIALPAAMAIAILRYRLYDIDFIVNRTAVYGSVTVLLLTCTSLVNVAIQRAVQAVTGQQSILVAVVVGVGGGLAFAPLRQRIRPMVDLVLPSRAVLTMLFNDIVGSTEAIVELGDARWRGLLARYLTTVRRELGRYHGREVNTAGDAFFATFSRPADGLECAKAIHSSVQGLGLKTRTGLHLGEVEMRGEEVSGLAVHTAARVMAKAGPGEILISQVMRSALADSAGDFQDRGAHSLKGVPGKWRLYSVAAQQTP